MFIDWLSMYQDFDKPLPYLGDTCQLTIDTDTGDLLSERCPTYRHQGSYSTSISIRVSGSRLTVSGNPSRFGRLDNLWGYQSVDDCVQVYNTILSSLGLPSFTRCTELKQALRPDGKWVTVTDGATITELHITSNLSVGQDNVLAFLRALSTQRYRNSIPRLHANGRTLDWLSSRGKSPLIYADVYDKANEIELHSLNKIKRLHGEDSDEYKYLLSVIDYCKKQGIVRFEQKLKSRYLRRESLQHYGRADYTKLNDIHQEFLHLPDRLQVKAMDMMTISEQLIAADVCKSMRSANATANYALLWMHGKKFDLSKSHIRTQRARLRAIGIDIAEPCDVTRFSPVRTIKEREITVTNAEMPYWYRQPSRVLLVA